MKVKIPTRLYNKWLKQGQKLAEQNIKDQLAMGVVKLDDLDKFGFEHLLTKEVQESIFAPLEAFYKGTGAAGPLIEKAKAKLNRMAQKVESKLNLEDVAYAAKHHNLKPKDNSNYWIELARKAERKRKRLEKKAKDLPDTEKEKIVKAAKTSLFKPPLPYNRPKR